MSRFRAAPAKPKRLADLVAKPGYAPRPGQSMAPPSLYASNLPPVAESPELERIKNLPIRPPYQEGSPEAEALVYLARERYGRETRGCNCLAKYRRKCILELHLVQAWALYELGLHRGLLGAIGVGHGKTVLDILAPLTIPTCRTAVLLVPPGVVTQLFTEYELLRNHWRVPGLISHATQQYTARVEGAPTLHVLPYSMLSAKDATTWLRNMAPDFVVADEVHSLRNPDTTRTSRVLRYFDNNPDARFAGWSGSLTGSDLEDFAHLAVLALREGSPLPTDGQVLQEWSGALSASYIEPRPPGALLDAFCEPGEHVRDGISRRLASTSGFVTTQTSSVDVAMHIAMRDLELPKEVEFLISEVRATWTRPDGEEITEAFSLFRCIRELACGLFYRWRFPRGEPVDLVMAWLQARKDWNRSVRYQLFSRMEHMDSPQLCQFAAMRGWGDLPTRKERPSWKPLSWPTWRDIKDQVKPETEAVRLSDFLVRDATQWARDHRGIVWYDIDDFGTWLSEVSGLPKHGGGQDAPTILAQEQGDRSIIASIKSHGVGRDGLQRLFSQQLVAQPPSTATTWEQLLGRLHRQGQANDVHTLFYAHTPELRSYIAKSLRRATYVEMLRNPQKIKMYGLALPESDEVEEIPPPPTREGGSLVDQIGHLLTSHGIKFDRVSVVRAT